MCICFSHQCSTFIVFIRCTKAVHSVSIRCFCQLGYCCCCYCCCRQHCRHRHHLFFLRKWAKDKDLFGRPYFLLKQTSVEASASFESFTWDLLNKAETRNCRLRVIVASSFYAMMRPLLARPDSHSDRVDLMPKLNICVSIPTPKFPHRFAGRAKRQDQNKRTKDQKIDTK